MPGFLATLGACFAGQCGIHALWNMLACPESPSIMHGLLDAASDEESSDEEREDQEIDENSHHNESKSLFASPDLGRIW